MTATGQRALGHRSRLAFSARHEAWPREELRLKQFLRHQAVEQKHLGPYDSSLTMLTEAGLISIRWARSSGTPKIGGQRGLDRIAVADQRDRLGRVKRAEPLDQPEHAGLHLDDGLSARDAAAATKR